MRRTEPKPTTPHRPVRSVGRRQSHDLDATTVESVRGASDGLAARGVSRRPGQVAADLGTRFRDTLISARTQDKESTLMHTRFVPPDVIETVAGCRGRASH